MARILVVDDERDILDLVRFNLEQSGHQVEGAESGRDALLRLGAGRFELVILDVMLPDLLGFEVLRRLRSREESREVPVILLTARGEESDVLVGFELGADDYVVKPFSPRELTARVRAVLQRAQGDVPRQTRLRFEGLELDLAAHQVFVAGREVVLAPQEYKLLAFLATHPRRVFSRENLLEQAWGSDVYVDPRTVDVHIRRLRAQVEANPAEPVFLETVRGAGYRFNPQAKRS